MKYLKRFNEIVDYDIDDSEIDGDYNGFVYLYSDKKLTIKDITPRYRIYLYNKADACDTDSEYIYQIKLKNPIYKKEELDIFSTDTKDETYSGFYERSWITQEILVHINSNEEITSFREIGGFCKYDKEKIEKLDIKLSKKTDEWLYEYISGKLNMKTPDDDIIKELEQFRPNKPIKIYKGIEEVQLRYYDTGETEFKVGDVLESYFSRPFSWTRNILIARTFVDDYPSSTPFVISMTINPDDVLVDVQKLPNKYYHTNQREIITLPGEYKYKIIWEGKL